MEKWYLLAERFVTAMENFGLACKYAVEDDLAGKDPVETLPPEVDRVELEPTAPKTFRIYIAALTREELLERCKGVGISLRNPGSSKDKRTETLKKEYEEKLQAGQEKTENPSAVEQETQATLQEVRLALQEVMKKRGMDAIIDIIRRVAGVVQIKDIPENKYAEILKEVDKL